MPIHLVPAPSGNCLSPLETPTADVAYDPMTSNDYPGLDPYARLGQPLLLH